MIKLITVDMDGTFLNDDKEMSPEFDKVFKALKEKGVKIFVQQVGGNLPASSLYLINIRTRCYL